MFFDDIIFNVKGEKSTMLFDANDGLMYGNMFKNEYVPYKNYNVAKLESHNEKGQLILKIYEYNFALNDLSLYLDLNPDDKNVYSLFKKYTEEQRACVELYEKKYGPLELDDSDYSSYMWYKEPWPFVGGNV